MNRSSSIRRSIEFLDHCIAAVGIAWASFAGLAPRALAQPAEGNSAVPEVLFTEGHAKLCTVKAGDVFPEVTIPAVGGGPTTIKALFGKQATVILFWAPDLWMSRAALHDLTAEAAKAGQSGEVAYVGVAVGQLGNAMQQVTAAAGGKFPQLLDGDGQAFAKIGIEALPRIYVLDGTGKIAWFDIEYSEATRRELAATLAALTSK